MELMHITLPVFFTLSMEIAATGITATDYERAVKAYREGKHQAAFSLFKQEAMRGEAASQYALCTFYRQGLVVGPDEQKAFSWCQEAARQGLSEAQFQLGLMYLEGLGVTESHEHAITWLMRAAEGGHPKANQVLQFIFSSDFNIGC